MPEQASELWCVAFVSTSIKDATAETAAAIIETVRKERHSQNLTGMSIFARGNNLIMCEGPKENVLLEYEQAKKHHAHHSLIKLYDGPIPFRFFEDSPLLLKVIAPDNFKPLDDFATPEHREYFEEFLNTEHMVARISRDFVKNNT